MNMTKRFMTALSLGETVGVSESTVVRFAHTAMMVTRNYKTTTRAG